MASSTVATASSAPQEETAESATVVESMAGGGASGGAAGEAGGEERRQAVSSLPPPSSSPMKYLMLEPPAAALAGEPVAGEDVIVAPTPATPARGSFSSVPSGGSGGVEQHFDHVLEALVRARGLVMPRARCVRIWGSLSL